MTNGIAVSSTARHALERLYPGRPLTLADYASTSGISLEVGDGVWVNAPLQEYNPNFVFAPTSVLLFDESTARFFVRRGNDEFPAMPLPVPDYHNEVTSSGELFTKFAVTHTDRVRISPIEGCAYRCTFCDIPTSFPKYQRKSVESLVESVSRAMRDRALPARHVLISGGTPVPADFDYLRKVYATVAERFPHIDVDVMMAPSPGLMDLEWMKDVGIHALSINLELYGQDAARRHAPNKKGLGLDWYATFLSKAVKVFGPGRVRSLLMVGLEPMEDTLKGVAFLADLGCQPVLSPFRPAPGTRLETSEPPSIEFLAETYLRSREIVERKGINLGPDCLPCQHNTLTFPEDAKASRLVASM